ncbi:short chain dehydrogenase [Nitzschia inconspicua]|uniref:Short chain dehydrogenase n=1 Tax=Nitzschia inconspicua TaxID=303405 RepID=A0A9K3LSI2_9STRA|nr:short chain dehydrogenase [Nitzschia inconspicua]
MMVTPPRVAVVTGANKGIGFYIALQLGLSGLFSNIIIGCRDATRGSTACQEIQQQVADTVKVQSMALTIGDRNSHSEFCKRMEEEFGKVDVLVNNAGFAYKGSDPTPFAGQTKKTLETNFFGLVDFTEQMLPLLRQGTDPRLVNVASMSGRLRQVSPELQAKFSDPNLTMEQLQQLIKKFERDVQNGIHREEGWSNSNYGISKLGVIAATRIWARQEAPIIAVNCCCPGYCATDMSGHKGSRSASDGAKNAVIPAIMDNPPTGEFFSDYAVSQW